MKNTKDKLRAVDLPRIVRPRARLGKGLEWSIMIVRGKKPKEEMIAGIRCAKLTTTKQRHELMTAINAGLAMLPSGWPNVETQERAAMDVNSSTD
jgi:hypothetical protein